MKPWTPLYYRDLYVFIHSSHLILLACHWVTSNMPLAIHTTHRPPLTVRERNWKHMGGHDTPSVLIVSSSLASLSTTRSKTTLRILWTQSNHVSAMRSLERLKFPFIVWHQSLFIRSMPDRSSSNGPLASILSLSGLVLSSFLFVTARSYSSPCFVNEAPSFILLSVISFFFWQVHDWQEVGRIIELAGCLKMLFWSRQDTPFGDRVSSINK